MHADNGREDLPPLVDRLRRERQWFEVALASIGDAVITADREGRVTFLNSVAQQLTAWTSSDAIGQPLPDVFRIVNESTRKSVENPALRAIREGVIFGLANHTVLVAKDGREIAIDDSGAPIRTETGEIIGAVLVFRDVTPRREAERAQSWLAEIVRSSEDAIISKDLNGVVMSWNPRAERMFGYAADEALGRPIIDLIIPDDLRDEEEMILARLRRGERIDHFETERLRKDGRRVPISLTVSPVRDPEGDIIGASKIARDIGERLHREFERTRLLASERTARERAEAAVRAKEEFVAIISHELRSPLTSILGWAQVLQRTSMDADALRRAVESIERSARAQVQLVDDLLDISRVITGKLALDTQPIDLYQTLQTAVESIRPAAETKAITIEVAADLEHTVVTGDADRLQQVFWNLLSNAVKFTPRSGRISVRMERIESKIQITVRDTGVGITAEFLPYVFDRFTQADSTSTRRGGLGLGLSIVKHLVELHGGTIAVASAGQGMGTTFTVRLPVRAVPDEATDEPGEPTLAERADLGGALRGMHILLVDDDPDTRTLLTALLEDHGALVKPSGSAAEALETVERWQPALIIADIGMPGEDGFSLITKIRGLASEARNVPAVALTAHARVEDRIRSLAAGFQMHVPKPVDVTELLLVVASFATRGKST